MKTMYDTCVREMTDDNSRFWTVFNVFTVVNGGLLAFCASGSADPAVKGVISLIAAIVCFVWQRIQARLLFWARWWHKKTEEVETYYLTELRAEWSAKSLTLPADIHVFRDRKPDKRPKGTPRWPGMSTGHAGTYLPLLFMLAWTLIFCITLRQHPSLWDLVAGLVG